MKKHKQKENIFAQKFHLLSSQESEEINWSSSESSDYETISTKANKVCNFVKKASRKRKRKQTFNKNISNLDITVIDVTKDHKDAIKRNNLEISTKKHESDNPGTKSPILGSTQYFLPYKCSDAPTSPIIGSKTLDYQSKVDLMLKSPILVLKTTSPRVSPNVRKELFKFDDKYNKATTDLNSNSNIMILNPNHCLDKRKFGQNHVNNNFSNSLFRINECKHSISNDSKTKEVNNVKNFISSNCSKAMIETLPINNRTLIVKEEIISQEEPKLSNIEINDLSQMKNEEEICIIEETPEPNMDDSMLMLRTASADLVKKVKNYFENQFSSGHTSQQTISEVSTPKDSSKTIDDVDIINITTQILTNRNSNESTKEVETVMGLDKKEKKIRYKKDGLAYRLNSLIKKQTASISLWKHERFLAANSNFLIPKGEFLAFRICKVNFKYGCHLLEAMDLNDDHFLILINSCHFNDNIETDCVIKLYEPYTKVDLNNNCILILNVTKFECVTIKK